MVPVVGLEPTPCRQERILSPSRLPFHHTGKYAIFFYRPERILSPSRRPRKLRIPRFGLASKARSLRCSSFPHSAGLVGSPGVPSHRRICNVRLRTRILYHTHPGISRRNSGGAPDFLGMAMEKNAVWRKNFVWRELRSSTVRDMIKSAGFLRKTANQARMGEVCK